MRFSLFGGLGRLARDKRAFVALKVLRNDAQRYLESAEREVTILETVERYHREREACVSSPSLPSALSSSSSIAAPSPSLSHSSSASLSKEGDLEEFPRGSVRMLGHFYAHGHPCIVFEPLACSLHVIQQVGHSPFLCGQIREIGIQLLHTLSILHSLNIIHGDVKPDNVLLRKDDLKVVEFGQDQLHFLVCNEVCLIDFGSACWFHHRPLLACTRAYRPAEVILGLPWDHKVDIWAVGCVLAQLYLGRSLFLLQRGVDEGEHLLLIEHTLGKIPQHMLDAASEDTEEEENANEDHELSTAPPCLPLDVLILDLPLLSLLKLLLNVDPIHRPSASQALQHPFFSVSVVA